MSFRTRGIRIVSSFALLCVLAAAAPALADPATTGEAAATPAAVDLAGRWEGRTYELARAEGCGGKACTLTLDLARCGSGWCGVEVTGVEQRCGATALKLDSGAANESVATVFKGNLALAKGTEPYVVEVYLLAPRSADDKTEIQITGDTGGEFRMFRRSFPFNATLVRISDAKCRPESTVSSLLE